MPDLGLDWSYYLSISLLTDYLFLLRKRPENPKRPHWLSAYLNARPHLFTLFIFHDPALPVIPISYGVLLASARCAR